jgi:type I restriction enzyme S subunit
VRFPGFAVAWEQHRFDELFAPVPNNSLSRAKLNYVSGDVKSIHYGDVLIKYGAITDCSKAEIPFVTDAEASDYQDGFLRDNDILIADAAEDETVGKATEIAGITDVPVVAGLHIIACRPKTKIARGYLGYYINSPSFHGPLLPLMQGTKVLSVSRSTLAGTTVTYPTQRQEQHQLGAFFASLDDLIALHQRKLTHLIQKYRKRRNALCLNLEHRPFHKRKPLNERNNHAC